MLCREPFCCVPRHVTPRELKQAGAERQVNHSSLSLWIGPHKCMDHWIIWPIFLGMFGIYLVPSDSYPLAEAEAEAEVTSPDIKQSGLSPFVLLASCLDTENNS